MNTKPTTLCLHAGTRLITMSEMLKEKQPKQTDTHHPIRHVELVKLVEDNLDDIKLTVTSREFAVTPNGKVFFGLLHVRNNVEHDDYNWTIGLRNSHDKSLRAGIVAGSRVFVCDNLAFYGNVVMFRTHTNQIEKDLGERIRSMLGKVLDSFKTMDARIAIYKARKLQTDEAASIVCGAAMDKVIDDQMVMPVLRYYQQPTHKEFEPRTAWSLFNSFTEIDKKLGIRQLPERMRKLHAFFDKVVGATN